MSFTPSGTVTPDQQPAQSHGLTGASGITYLLAAIANRNASRVDIPVIGDSITEGQGASAFTNRYIAQANRAIRAAYPTTANGSAGGLGFIPVASTGEGTYAWPVSKTGGAGWFSHPEGPVRGGVVMNAAGSFTWTAPAGTTSVKIMYYNSADGSQFSYQVAAGGAITVTTGGTAGDGALTASIAITSGQLLTIAWVSGTIYMEGIVHWAADEASGITLHGCGHFGWQAGQAGDANAWNQTGYGPGFPWQPSIAALTPGAAALGILLGVNDAASYSAAAFSANLGTLLAGLRATAGLTTIPLILIIPYQPVETLQDPGGWSAYAAAIRAAASAYAPAFVVDLNYRMPSVASGAYGGALYADSFHPTNLGHALVGEIAAGALRVA